MRRDPGFRDILNTLDEKFWRTILYEKNLYLINNKNILDGREDGTQG
jgi:hypothetical protein